MQADLGIPLPTGPALGGFGKHICHISRIFRMRFVTHDARALFYARLCNV